MPGGGLNRRLDRPIRPRVTRQVLEPPPRSGDRDSSPTLPLRSAGRKEKPAAPAARRRGNAHPPKSWNGQTLLVRAA